MPDSTFGQGFTASIVNSIPNYLSSDRSTLGMVDGVSGAIQYVKLVWGGSGEAKFVSETGSDPSALPVSLSNADNFWLIDSVLNTVHTTSSGLSAWRVILDGSGVCFAGACFGSINIGAGITVIGFGAGAINANLGVTFGNVGVTAPSGLRVRNYLSGAGVTESLQVTGGVYVLGGTVALSNQLSVDFGNGVTIAGIRAGLTLPVSIGAGGISLGSDQILTRINSIAGGVTISVALTTPGGTFFPHAYLGIPVFGVTNGTPIGVTFSSGLIGITQNGLLGVTFSGSFSSTTTIPATGITIAGFLSTAVVGITTNAPIEIFANQLIGVTIPAAIGMTLGTVRVIGIDSQPIGVSLGNLGLVGISGDSLRVSFDGGGLCLGSVSASLSLPASGITIATIKGGTLDAVTIKGGTLTTLGGTVSISNASISVTGIVSANINNANGSPVPISITSYQTTAGQSIKTALDGVSVTFTGNPFAGITTISSAGSTYLGVFVTGAISSQNGTVGLNTNSEILVKGHIDTRGFNPTSPVGITLTGGLYGLTSFGMSSQSGRLLGVSFYGVGLCGDALKVSLDGVGFCFGGGITIAGLSFPTYFGISGGVTINGGTISFISGGTFNVLGGTITGILNTVNVTFGTGIVSVKPSSSTTVFSVHPVKSDGSLFPTPADGFPVYGTNGATPVGITWSGLPYLGGISNGITINNFDGTVKGHTDTRGFNPTSPVGITLTGGLYGLTSFGMSSQSGRLLGVSFYGVGLCGDALKVSLDGVGFCFGGGITIAGLSFPTYFGISGGVTINGGTISFISGGTFNVLGGTITGISNTVDVTFGNKPVHIIPYSTGGIFVTFGAVLSNNFGTPLGMSGTTVVGIPVFGLADTYFGISYGMVLDSINSSLRTTGGVYLLGQPSVAIASGTISTITNAVKVTNDTVAGSSLAVMIYSAVPIKPNTTSITFGTVISNNFGNPLGMSGTTVVGVPMFGVLGATSIAVTFGTASMSVTFGGVTFGGVTFGQTRTIISGSAFADGGNNLGIPVYGVAGTTAVRVSIEGGTVAGIFIADSPGITVLGLSSGLPIHGVFGATAVGVTISGPISTSVVFPATGITIGSIISGITVGITGSVHLLGTPNVNVGTVPVTIGSDVPVKAGTEMTTANSDKLVGLSMGKGLLITEKAGSAFALGMTLGPFLLETLSDQQPNVVGVSGTTFYYFSTTPRCVTSNYSGDGRDGTVGAHISVPLKQGLYVQLTKWDLISHVLVGYTAGSLFEFERNAQVLTREYQVAPLWSHAMDQYRRFPGYTGNNNPIRNNKFDSMTDPNPSGTVNASAQGEQSIMSVEFDPGNTDRYFTNPAAQKQYIGVVEKPSRIFVPCRNAGEVFIQVKGDYQSHAIGAGFWDHESGRWSSTSLHEREYYARSISGHTGNGEPSMTTEGAGASGSVEYGVPIAKNITQAGGPSGFTPAITSIISSYAQNPFIRIWGY